MRLRRSTVLCAFALLACRDSHAPEYEIWTTQFGQHVLSMRMQDDEGTVTGSAALGRIGGVGVENLGLSGQRRLDSLYLTFTRPLGDEIWFNGAYQGTRFLTGRLRGVDGGDVTVSFRRIGTAR